MRWLVGALFLLFIAPIVTLNVERLAEKYKWDQLLTTMKLPAVSDLAQIGAHPATWVLAALFFGATIDLWTDYRLLRRELEFFPNRKTLDRSRDYDDFLGTADTIYACYVTGRKLRQYDIKNISHVREVILPDPTSKSFLTFANSIGEPVNQQLYVCQVTKYLKQERRINVLWYPEMIYASIKIGDPEKTTGWVHVEHVLPHSPPNTRPSFTVHGQKYSHVVRHY